MTHGAPSCFRGRSLLNHHVNVFLTFVTGAAAHAASASFNMVNFHRRPPPRLKPMRFPVVSRTAVAFAGWSDQLPLISQGKSG
jgi:hypothetical protein